MLGAGETAALPEDLKFNSQKPEGSLQLSITLVLEILIPLWEPGMHFGQSDLCELDLANSTQYAEMFYIKLIFLLI